MSPMSLGLSSSDRHTFPLCMGNFENISNNSQTYCLCSDLCGRQLTQNGNDSHDSLTKTVVEPLKIENSLFACLSL